MDNRSGSLDLPMIKERFRSLIGSYPSGDLILPGDISKFLKIGICDAYELLEEEEDNGTICQVFRLSCPHCGTTNEYTYGSFDDMPDLCPFCGRFLDFMKSTIVLYRKL